MKTKRFPLNDELNSTPNECSIADVSKRLFERSLTLAEVVEISEKCGFWAVEQPAEKTYVRPFTFVIPSNQVFGSVSRIVE